MEIHENIRGIDLRQQSVRRRKGIVQRLQEHGAHQIQHRHPAPSQIQDLHPVPRAALRVICRSKHIPALKDGKAVPALKGVVPGGDEIRSALENLLGGGGGDAVARGGILPVDDGHVRPILPPQLRQRPLQVPAAAFAHHVPDE